MAKQRNVFWVWTDAVLIASINVYQKYLSPRKGWRCAYGALHGGTGCSGFAKSAIQAHGWRESRPLVRQRFLECKLAGQQLRELRAQNEASALTFAGQPSGRKKRENLLSGLDCGPSIDCDPCCDKWSHNDSSCDSISCDACNVPPCDCSW